MRALHVPQGLSLCGSSSRLTSPCRRLADNSHPLRADVVSAAERQTQTLPLRSCISKDEETPLVQHTGPLAALREPHEHQRTPAAKAPALAAPALRRDVRCTAATAQEPDVPKPSRRCNGGLALEDVLPTNGRTSGGLAGAPALNGRRRHSAAPRARLRRGCAPILKSSGVRASLTPAPRLVHIPLARTAWLLLFPSQSYLLIPTARSRSTCLFSAQQPTLFHSSFFLLSTFSSLCPAPQHEALQHLRTRRCPGCGPRCPCSARSRALQLIRRRSAGSQGVFVQRSACANLDGGHYADHHADSHGCSAHLGGACRLSQLQLRQRGHHVGW